MLDKLISSIMQSPKLLADALEGKAEVLEKYALTQDDIFVLREMFSARKDPNDLAVELAGTHLNFDEVSWWPPIFP